MAPTISGGRVHYVRSLLAGELGSGGSFLEYRISSGRRRRSVLAARSRSDVGRHRRGQDLLPSVRRLRIRLLARARVTPGTGGPCLLNELTP